MPLTHFTFGDEKASAFLPSSLGAIDLNGKKLICINFDSKAAKLEYLYGNMDNEVRSFWEKNMSDEETLWLSVSQPQAEAKDAKQDPAMDRIKCLEELATYYTEREKNKDNFKGFFQTKEKDPHKQRSVKLEAALLCFHAVAVGATHIKSLMYMMSKEERQLFDKAITNGALKTLLEKYSQVLEPLSKEERAKWLPRDEKNAQHLPKP